MTNLPDSRGWLVVGLFSLLVLELILHAIPDLRADAILADAVKWTEEALMVAIGFYFVSSKKDPDAK